MNVEEVKSRVKRTFGDESAVQLTDDDIINFINDAQREIIQQNPETLEKIVVTDTVLGQQDYTFPADLQMLRSLSYRRESTQSYSRLQGKSLQEFDEIIDRWDGPSHSQGNPQYWCTFANNFKLWPIPDIAVTEGLKLFYYRNPVDVALDADEIDLPVGYHLAVVKYVLKSAYEMDEDWTSVGNKAQEFNFDVAGQKTREKQQHQETYQVITVLSDDQGYDY
jgi:hypothetical protein